jgi:hypothetical protein
MIESQPYRDPRDAKIEVLECTLKKAEELIADRKRLYPCSYDRGCWKTWIVRFVGWVVMLFIVLAGIRLIQKAADTDKRKIVQEAHCPKPVERPCPPDTCLLF